MTTRTLARRAALVAAAATAVLALTACGGETSGSGTTAGAPGASATATAHNAQDVRFAQGMIPHHRQALEMARLAAGRASSARVKDLAARIEKAQDPEIRTMTGWLRSWGEQVPTAGMDHSAHSGHTGMPGMSGMPGMMGDDDMTALKKAHGRAFDTAFLSLMVEHHRGAVEMAGTERSKGAYGPARRTADDIVTAQNAEIKEMKKLLGAG
ncbi:hypothetical protein GCM10010503_21410 [Streptomyces lucensis JCM 4490]|uniref:DUF305 domain-containing protein n=1 Tax=Streptomyces lucensis JCM 4490 TaxID=1306176 RepID=A0A918J5Q6_9ACTN|nr:DUF305 domain-containing protein [Streptomyces lucensis]GGW44321.1 hypothetical protein GCM10010503_21410 [Streptomyces lucensis JCM 4490]